MRIWNLKVRVRFFHVWVSFKKGTDCVDVSALKPYIHNLLETIFLNPFLTPHLFNYTYVHSLYKVIKAEVIVTFNLLLIFVI